MKIKCILVFVIMAIGPLTQGFLVRHESTLGGYGSLAAKANKETNFELVRRTAPYYWKWAQINQDELKKAELLADGIVSGDPHVLNFGLAFSSDQYTYALLDMDDAGRAPLILDAIQLFIATRSLQQKITIEELVEVYMKGLSGKKSELPRFLKNEYVKPPKFDVEKFRTLSKLEDTDEKVGSIFKKVKPIFLRAAGVEEFDSVRIQIKSSGGSKGKLRFWVSFTRGNQKNGATEIIEFKELSEPATSFYQTQLGTTSRFKEVSEMYRPLKDDEFKLVETVAGFFYSDHVECIQKKSIS